MIDCVDSIDTFEEYWHHNTVFQFMNTVVFIDVFLNFIQHYIYIYFSVYKSLFLWLSDS